MAKFAVTQTGAGPGAVTTIFDTEAEANAWASRVGAPSSHVSVQEVSDAEIDAGFLGIGGDRWQVRSPSGALIGTPVTKAEAEASAEDFNKGRIKNPAGEVVGLETPPGNYTVIETGNPRSMRPESGERDDIWQIEHLPNKSVKGLDWLVTLNGEPYHREWSEAEAKAAIGRFKAEAITGIAIEGNPLSDELPTTWGGEGGDTYTLDVEQTDDGNWQINSNYSEWTMRIGFQSREEAEAYLRAYWGNPHGDGIPLHEQLAAAADHVDYEADVVEDAAEALEQTDAPGGIVAAAEDQAEKMEEAADALDEAADAARETTAEVFTETGVPEDQQVTDVTAGGNPETNEVPEVTPEDSQIVVEEGNPGKFEGVDDLNRVSVQNLYELTPDDEHGSVDEGGWYGLYNNRNNEGGWIIAEDTQGFVTGFYHDDVGADWTALVEGNPVLEVPGTDTTPLIPVETEPIPDTQHEILVPVAAESAPPTPEGGDLPPESQHWYTKTLFGGSK